MKINTLYTGQVVKSEQGLSGLISNISVGTTKKGDPYYNVTIQDDTGEILVKIWNNDFDEKTAKVLDKFTQLTTKQKELIAQNTAESISSARLISPVIVSVAGNVSEYNGTLQMTSNGGLTEITPTSLLEYFYCPVTDAEAKAMKSELRNFISQIESEDIANIVRLVLNDPIVARDFFIFPAAIGHHHAYRYGLLQHTLQVLKYALALYDAYPVEHKKVASRDLVIASAILHDLGKIEEYYYFLSNNVIEYNDYGAQHRASSLAIVREILAEHGLRNKYNDIMGKIGKVIFEHHGFYGTETEFKNTKVMESKFIFSADMLSAGLAPALQEAAE